MYNVATPASKTYLNETGVVFGLVEDPPRMCPKKRNIFELVHESSTHTKIYTNVELFCRIGFLFPFPFLRFFMNGLKDVVLK